MKIKDKTCIVFDIEVLKNIFTCTCKNTETGVIKVFEISSRKVDIQDLLNYFTQDCYYVGYNNHHYDNPVLNYIFSLYRKRYFEFFSTREITESIFRMSQIVIDKNSVENIKKCIYKLKAIYQIPLMLHAVHGYSVNEIGQLLDLNTKTVQKRLERARQKIKTMLKEEI